MSGRGVERDAIAECAPRLAEQAALGLRRIEHGHIDALAQLRPQGITQRWKSG